MIFVAPLWPRSEDHGQPCIDRPGVTETGKRTFMLQTRYPGSQQPTRRSLGEYGAISLDDARQKARNWLELIRKGIDPAVAEAEARQAALSNTFAAVAEDYLRLRVIGPDPARPRQRRAAEVAREFRRLFVALWGERPITSISRHDVLSLIEGVRDQGTAATLAAYGKGKKADKSPAPVQARNLLGYLKTFFSWAIERGTYGFESSPCDHLGRQHHWRAKPNTLTQTLRTMRNGSNASRKSS